MLPIILSPRFLYHIRERAEHQGLDQSKLSRRADVSREAIRRYWTNTVQHPDLTLLHKVAMVLNCRICDLISLQEDDGVYAMPHRPPAQM